MSKGTIKDLMAKLVKDGYVKITDQKVDYKIPKVKKQAKKS